MSLIAIRLIGGVLGGAIGTYVSGKIYDYIYKPKPQIKDDKENEANVLIIREIIEQPKPLKPKTFEEIMLDIREKNKHGYEYDNEPGNDGIINKNIIINDAIYDNNFRDDYYDILQSIASINN